MQPRLRDQDGSPNGFGQLPEQELVERARTGDREAFGELVRLHRAKALDWASSIAQDTYAAEDIVQESLIRAFLHLGSLANPGSFIPWFKRIVRNQAHMRVRRGGLYGREQPFSSVETWEEADWRDIDSILFQLSRSVLERGREQDPSVVVMRKDMIEHIHTLLYCLSHRERAIFEAHFFRHLSVHELAVRFGTPKSNIYTLLSRSRKKVQKERIRVHFQSFAKRRGQQLLPTKNILARPFDF